jgi:tetrahydromethanopterin S-methyltransferase subunit B
MNKARIRQEYTVSGSFVSDAVYGVLIGLSLFAGLVLFLSW